MLRSRIPLYTFIGVVVFLYLPLVIVTGNSFNDTRYGGEWNGFTLKWYERLYTDEKIIDALRNTLIIAFSSSIAAVIIGTCAALALHKYKNSLLQSAHSIIIYIPLMIPDILLGISLLMFFVSLKFEFGLFTIFIAHTTFSVSYVTLTVIARLQNFDESIMEAAYDLGASKFTSVRRILIPLIAPGIIAGGLMTFILSIDDFVITFFVSGPGSTTLPLYIYSMMRHGSPMVINSLTTVFIIVTFILIFFGQKIMEANK